jgi:hypothetical protein
MKPKIRSASITLSTFAAPAATASRATLEDPLTAYQGESNAAGRAPPTASGRDCVWGAVSVKAPACHFQPIRNPPDMPRSCASRTCKPHESRTPGA